MTEIHYRQQGQSLAERIADLTEQRDELLAACLSDGTNDHIPPDGPKLLETVAKILAERQFHGFAESLHKKAIAERAAIARATDAA